MKVVSIFVPEQAVPAAITDPHYLFAMLNKFLEQSGKPALFKVQLAGLTKEIQLQNGSFSISPDLLLSELEHTDLLIIPALSGDVLSAVQLNQAATGFIRKFYKNGSEIASLCTGAFLLASTGLLKGKPCSTHWMYTNTFRAAFPDVLPAGDKVITEQNGIYTSGGGTSYWNLLLHLVEKYTDRETAILTAKYFLLDINRYNQSAFSLFKGQKAHNDAEVQLAQEYIEEHFREKITVAGLSEKFAITRRSFERRFKKATGNSVVEYTQRVKVEMAKKQIEAGRKTIAEVMHETGYTDPKAFRDVFKKITGLSPAGYRSIYVKDSRS